MSQQYNASGTSPFTRKLREFAALCNELSNLHRQGKDAYELLFLREQPGTEAEAKFREQEQDSIPPEVAAKLQEARAWFADLGIAVVIHQGRVILQQESDEGEPPLNYGVRFTDGGVDLTPLREFSALQVA